MPTPGEAFEGYMKIDPNRAGSTKEVYRVHRDLEACFNRLAEQDGNGANVPLAMQVLKLQAHHIRDQLVTEVEHLRPMIPQAM